MTRKEFLRTFVAIAGGAFLVRPARARAESSSGPFRHPEPRPGITAADVLPESKLPKEKAVRDAYAAARAHPEIFDGLACACGCHDEHRSLLTCYETMQPTGCHGCVAEAKVVGREAAAG